MRIMREVVSVLCACWLMAAAPVVQFAGHSDEQKAAAFFPDEAWNPNLLKGKDTPPPLLPADLNTTVPPFPANLSAETRAELDDLLKKQAEERTPENLARIEREDNTNWYLERAFVEDGLMPAKAQAPALHALLDAVAANTWYFIMYEKHKHKRARPTQLEEKLTTAVPLPRHAAYPSGHATQGYSTALVLAELDPAHAAEYLALGNAIGVRREIAGVHYRSDTQAGQSMATALVSGLLATDAIQQMLPAARDELLAFRRASQ